MDCDSDYQFDEWPASRLDCRPKAPAQSVPGKETTRAADHRPGPRRPRRSDGGQPAGDGFLRARAARCSVSPAMAARAAARRSAPTCASMTARCACAATSNAPMPSCASTPRLLEGQLAGHGACRHAGGRQFGPRRRALRAGAARLPGDSGRRPGDRAPPRPRAHRQLGPARRPGVRAAVAHRARRSSARWSSRRLACTTRTSPPAKTAMPGRGATAGDGRMNAVVTPASPIPAIWTTGSTAGHQDRHLARGPAAACACALPLPCRLPGARRHRRVDRPGARGRFPRRVADPVAPQPLPGGHRPHLPPPLRERLQPRRPRRSTCRSASSSAASATSRSNAAGPTTRRRCSAASASPSSAAGRPGCRRRTSCAAAVMRVTLFESQPELGGLMRHGIPGYRLARTVLDARDRPHHGDGHRACAAARRCDSPQALAELQRRASTRSTWPSARSARNDCRSSTTRQPWVVDGADYLARASRGAPPALGPARGRDRRRQRRDGRGTQRTPRRPRRDDPGAGSRTPDAGAARRSRRGAGGRHQAGRRARCCAALPKLSTRTRAACASIACACSLKPGAQRGKFTVTPQPGSEFTLEADAIVSAIGQDPDLAPLAAALRRRRPLAEDRCRRRHHAPTGSGPAVT